MMQRHINITIKSVYGKDRAYPACDTSRIFANMLNVKTLTRENLKHILSLGYYITCNTNQWEIDASDIE